MSRMQLLLRPKRKLFQTRGAAIEKRRLPDIVLHWDTVNSNYINYWPDALQHFHFNIKRSNLAGRISLGSLKLK